MSSNAEPLSDLALFGWGCLGGLTAAVLTFTVPWLVEQHAKARDGEGGWPSFFEVAYTGGILLVWAFVGGVAALVGGAVAVFGGKPTEPHQAIAFGLVWPLIFKGVGQTFKDAAGRLDDQQPDEPNSNFTS